MNRPKQSYKKTTRSAAWGGTKAIVLVLILVVATASVAQTSKVSPDLASMSSTLKLNVVIQYHTAPTSTDATIAKKLGATNGKALGRIKGMKYTMTAGNATKLPAADANVKYISPDRALRNAMDTAAVAVQADLGRALGFDGTGIGVAVIDSGVTNVTDLRVPGTTNTRVVYNQNFDPSTIATTDLYGHGTHVAGIIAGNATSSECGTCDVQMRGIAPNANIINLRALDANGQATDSTVIAAIQRAIELKDQYNIRVINLSLGRGVFESYAVDPLCQAAEQAWQAGIVVVVAAGNYGRDNSSSNNGYGTITAPGNDPYVITVGAMKTMGTQSRADDLIATYSSKGPSMLDHVVKPDLVAPGNLVASDLASTSATLFRSYPANQLPIDYYMDTNNTVKDSSVYYRLSGTSMAAPMVSGTVALMLQKDPALTPDQVKARLMKTAYKNFPQSSTYTDPVTGVVYTQQYDIFTVGTGYLDAYAALNSTDLAPNTVGAALSPSAAYDAATGQVYLVNGNSVTWGSSVIWGSSVLWGSSVVWGSSVIWGSNSLGQSVLWGSSVCWGSNTNTGFSVIWGSSVVWGTKSNSDAMSVSIGGDR
jgi:serine protease AprX